MIVAGIDIGGTKCTIILGEIDLQAEPVVIGKSVLQTREYPDPYKMIDRMKIRIGTDYLPFIILNFPR